MSSMRFSSTLGLLWLASVLVAAGGSFAQPVELGPEFRVNTTPGNYPDVAIDHDGDFVVVWQEWREQGAALRSPRAAPGQRDRGE